MCHRKLNGVFCCREQIEVCVEILGRVLQALEPIQLAQSYKMALQSGLNHPDDSVRVLTLTQVSAEGALKSAAVCPRLQQPWTQTCFCFRSAVWLVTLME